MGSRTAFAMVGWLVAAAVATVVGLAAVRVIGEGITGTAATTLTQEEVAEALASPEPSAGPEPTAGPDPSASPEPTRATSSPTILRPAGSTITAHCEDGLVTIDLVAAPQGYSTTEYDEGPTDEAEVRFDRGGKGHGSGRVEVHVTCVDGKPRATIDD
ncbi:septum formation initiator [Phytohabitans suffuscus]|nr:septum formation initiator [Phytohabitans suffuscus]